VNSHLFDSLDSARNFYDFLNNDFHWSILGDVVVHWFFNLYNLGDFHDFINVSGDFNNARNFNTFNDNLSSYFRYSDNFLLDNWYLNSSIHNFFHFFHQSDNLINHFFNFFYSIPVDNLFLNYFYFLDLDDLDLHLNNLFNGLWHLHNLLNGLDDGDWLLDYHFYDLR